MDRYFQLACCLYFLSYELTAFPLFNPQSSSYNDVSDDVTNMCHRLAISRLLDDDSFPLPTDFLLSLRSETEINNMDSARTDGYSDKLYGLGNNLLNEKEIEAITTRIDELRNACVMIYTSETIHSTKRSKKDQENFKLIESDNFSDRGLKEFLSKGSSGEARRRNTDLGLNPTGWRKRRSGRNSEATQTEQQFLRNMREILEKRERLQFNPTGW